MHGVEDRFKVNRNGFRAQGYQILGVQVFSLQGVEQSRQPPAGSKEIFSIKVCVFTFNKLHEAIAVTPNHAGSTHRRRPLRGKVLNDFPEDPFAFNIAGFVDHHALGKFEKATGASAAVTGSGQTEGFEFEGFVIFDVKKLANIIFTSAHTLKNLGNHRMKLLNSPAVNAGQKRVACIKVVTKFFAPTSAVVFIPFFGGVAVQKTLRRDLFNVRNQRSEVEISQTRGQVLQKLTN